MRDELKTCSVMIDQEMGTDFIKIFSESEDTVAPFMNLFCQEQ